MAKLISADISNNKLCILEYTTTDGQMLSFKEDAFDAKIVSHTYTHIGKVIFDKPITKIGERAFADCDSLTSVTIPDSVKTIETGAFIHCHNLTNVTIPDSVTTIGECAFINCRNLKEFNGKYAVDSGRCLIINGALNAFAIGCGITDYTIPDSVTTIGNLAFSCCSSLISVTIPDSVTEIGTLVFWGCSSLTNITIPNSITEIGDRTFLGCSSLISITIPNSVTEIGEYAFYCCSSLINVTIGNSVNKIGNKAFSCRNILTNTTCDIDTIVCYPKIPPKINDSFDRFENLIVPTGCEEAYANSDWGQYLE